MELKDSTIFAIVMQNKRTFHLSILVQNVKLIALFTAFNNDLP